jgi:exodeoxyribonuclease VII large subunit
VGTATASRIFRRPLDLVHDRQRRIDESRSRLASALQGHLRDRRRRIEVLAGQLDALSPLKVLGRGYSLTRMDGRVVTHAEQVAAGDELETLLFEGRLRSRVL